VLVAHAIVRSIHYVSIVGLAALCACPVVLRLAPERGFARYERILAVAALLSWCALLGLTVVGWNDGNWLSLADPATWEVLVDTSFGQIWCWRFILLVACVVVCPGSHLTMLRIGLAELACVSIALAGHAGADPHPIGALHVGIDAVHLLSASFWPGGLLYLFLVLRPGRKPLRQLPQLVSRFSTMSLIAAGVLLASGSGNTILGVEHWDFGGLYLRTLGIKLVLVAALMSIGSTNLLRYRPALVHVIDDADRDQVRGTIRKLVAWECALALLVFVAVGFLTLLPP
jgi:copper resistance protein D